MGAFLAGIAAAVILSLVAGFGLNAWDLSTAEHLTTEETAL